MSLGKITDGVVPGSGGGGGSPGGSQYDVQTNNGSGGFAGSSQLTFNGLIFEVNGGLALGNHLSLTTSAVIPPDAPFVDADATAEDIIATLPTAPTEDGVLIFVTKIDSTAHTVTIVPGGGDTLLGGDFVLTAQAQTFSCYYDIGTTTWIPIIGFIQSNLPNVIIYEPLTDPNNAQGFVTTMAEASLIFTNAGDVIMVAT